MKTRKPNRIALVLFTFVCLLWSSQALALPSSAWFQGNVFTADLLPFDLATSTAGDPIATYNGGTFKFDLSPTSASYSQWINGSLYNLEMTAKASLLLTDGNDADFNPLPDLTISDVTLYGALFNPAGKFFTSASNSTVSFGDYAPLDPSDPDYNANDPLNITYPFLALNKLGGYAEAGQDAYSLFFFLGPDAYQLDLTVDTLDSNMQPVPEPSTIVLIGVGLAGLGISRRLRSRKQS